MTYFFVTEGIMGVLAGFLCLLGDYGKSDREYLVKEWDRGDLTIFLISPFIFAVFGIIWPYMLYDYLTKRQVK